VIFVTQISCLLLLQCCDKATSSYICPVRMNRAVAPSPVQFKLIPLLLSVLHIAFIYIHACIPAGLLVACFSCICVRAACSSREHPSDAIRRCGSHYIFYQITDLLNLTFYQIPFYQSPFYQIPDLLKVDSIRFRIGTFSLFYQIPFYQIQSSPQ
jgi:hypothetical protein